MPTRRDFLLTGAMFAVAGTSSWEFDSDSALLRYRNWLARFKRDIAQLSAEVSGTAGVFEEQVRIICKSSIVPHSRATLMINDWLMGIADKPSGHRGVGRYVDLGSVVMLLLGDSVPAGFGGLFPEALRSRFPSHRYSVWYMHIAGPEALQAYFNDKAHFPNYQLPPNGTLKRHTYPFLLFEDAGNTLRLAGVGAEWMGAAVYLYRKQYA
ncbi:hypothetical protein ACSUZJ_05750 [Telluria sp. B2]